MKFDGLVQSRAQQRLRSISFSESIIYCVNSAAPLLGVNLPTLTETGFVSRSFFDLIFFEAGDEVNR